MGGTPAQGDIIPLNAALMEFQIIIHCNMGTYEKCVDSSVNVPPSAGSLHLKEPRHVGLLGEGMGDPRT
jgi:hypothetical protein